MFLVGLTGGVATGKSTVAQMFTSSYGVPVVDADLLARRVVAKGTRAWTKIRAAFGDAVLVEPDGEIDRAALRRVVFEDPELRARLNAFTHPEIYRLMCWEVAKCALAAHQYVILDVPLLFEANVMVEWMHKVIVVTCEEDLQVQRMMEKRGLSEHESKQIMAAQMPLEEKVRRADYVVENSGSLRDSADAVREVHEAVSSSNFHWKVRLAVGLALGAVGGVVSVVWAGLRRKWGGAGGADQLVN